MLKTVWKNLEKYWFAYTIMLTFIMEAITCLFRFALCLESTRDTQFISKITFGIRIHHGYVGIMIFLLSFFFLKGKNSKWYWMGIIIGLSLFLSDMIHHFLVLWPITGSPEFHLTYPT